MSTGFTGFTAIAASGPLLVALAVCLLAGLVSFASPCVVPLVPGYLSYLAAIVGVDETNRAVGAGTAVKARPTASRWLPPTARRLLPPTARRLLPPTARWRVAGSAALFVAGFTVVFLLGTIAVLGMTTTLITNQLVLQRVGGGLTILMGLVFVGYVPALQRQVRFAPRQLSTVAGAPLLGAVFALGWTPCLGPTLTGVITIASATDGANVARGILLVIAYCLGLGIPFVLLAFGSAAAVASLGWLRRHTRALQIFGGALLIAVGVALVTGVWNDFVSWLRDALVSDVRLPI
jgi:cytochrome c-type biogenesis protein